MANNSFLDYIWDAVPSASDVGEYLGYNVPKWGARGTQTGLRPAPGESYGFLDLAGDIGSTAWDYGKRGYTWGRDVIKSETFKDIVAIGKKYYHHAKHEGQGDLAFQKALADMAPKGTAKSLYKSAPFIGFRPSTGGRRTAGPGGKPVSWDMVDALKKNRRMMENIRNEIQGNGYGTPYNSSNVNLSPKAQLKSIAVRNPYATGYGLAGIKHKID